MTNLKILAITLNWRQPKTTIECVRALQAMHYPELDILVIDNGSRDDSLGLFNQELPSVLVKALPTNIGFASGSNVGICYALDHGYDYALLINNDAFPAPDMLSKLTAVADPDIALCAPKIFYEQEPTRLWFAGGIKHPNLLEIRKTGRGKLDNSDWGSRDVDYLLGTCLLINLNTINDIGLFDQRYFMYYEDLDWCIRFRQFGYRLRFVSDAHLYHRVAVSTGGLDSPLRLYYIGKSSVIFFYTHAKQGKPLYIFFYRVVSILKKTTHLLLTKQFTGIYYYLKGLRDGWKNRLLA